MWFFSLDVNKRLPVWAANTFFHLPYFHAEVEVQRTRDTVHYRHHRGELIFEADYTPVDEPFTPEAGSFNDWSTTRYCLYAESKRGRLYRGHIHHSPWPLQPAEVTLHQNTLLDTFQPGERHPSALYSRELHVVVYPLEQLK